VREDRLAARGGHELAELDAVGLGLVGHEDVDRLGVGVVELDLDGVGGLAAVRVGEGHVGSDARGADRALGRLLAQARVQGEQHLAHVRAVVVVVHVGTHRVQLAV
jgi:hypothetical protein